jgi:hypothetical protein
VADLSQVGSNECPQGEAVEAKEPMYPFMPEKSARSTISKISNISTWPYIFKHPPLLLSILQLHAALMIHGMNIFELHGNHQGNDYAIRRIHST